MTSLESTSLLKKFIPLIGAYQDVSAIYTKLCSQGQLQKVVNVLTEIYDEEHVFMLTELQNYCKNNNEKEDEFVAEQYENNSNIFRRNLVLITQTLVEEIGKRFLERFRQDYSSEGPTDEVSFKQHFPTEQSGISEKTPYKSHMPEIQEEMENPNIVNRLPKPQQPEEHYYANNQQQQNNNKTFDINISELTQKVQSPHATANFNQLSNQREYQTFEGDNQVHQNGYETHPQRAKKQASPPQNQGQNQIPHPNQYQHQQQQHQHHQQQLQQKQYQQQQQQQQQQQRFQAPREETYETPYKSDTSGFGYSDDQTRANDFSQYDNDNGTFRVSQEKFHSASQNRTPQSTGMHWSSPDRTNALGRKNAHLSPSQRNSKLLSPGRSERGTANMQSFSKWSNSNGRPDPSVLDSEFSYTQGGSFSKSPKKFHFNILDVPGPGDYTIQEGVQATKVQHPNHSFSKSPKTPSYFTKSKVPGPIYYPIHFFTSNKH